MERVNKKYLVILNVLVAITLGIDWSLAEEFDYKNVDSWAQIAPECGGQRQSPVEVSYGNGYGNISEREFFIMNGYNKPLSTKLLNDGHKLKIEFEWNENETPYMAGDIFEGDEYVLDSIHFHWSRTSKKGSEHILTGRSYPLEMQFVHYNRKYGNLANASNFLDGLAISASLFDTRNKRRRRDDWTNYILATKEGSSAVSQILSNVESVRTPGSSIDIEPFAIIDIRPIPLIQTVYATYLGSLTTPPCTENVVWLLSTYPHQINEEEFQLLQSTVEFDNGDDHNNRPVHLLNGRKYSALRGYFMTLD